MANEEAPSKTFQFDNWLSDRDMKFVSKTPDGQVLVEDPTGKVAPINMDTVYKDISAESGVPVDKLKTHPVRYNTQFNPVNISPVSLSDRSAVKSYGNTKGAMSYLKNKFEEVEYNPDLGLVVKDKGVWHSVDPSGLGGGSAWDKTKELAKDIFDNQDIAITGMATAAGVAGATALAVAAAPVAAPVAGGALLATQALGAGIGAGGAAYFRTMFGKALGTYDATPEETLKDVAMETVLGMGGQAVAPGVKMSADNLIKAGKYIGGKAVGGVQDMLSSVYGAITGVGQPAMQALYAAPNRMVGTTNSLIAKAGSGATYEGIQDIAKQENIGILNNMMQSASKKLPQKYGQYLNELFDEAGEKGFQANMGEIVENVAGRIEKQGLGQFVPKSSPSGAKIRARMVQEGVELPPQARNFSNGNVEFRPFSSDEATSLTINSGGEQTGYALSKQEMRVVKPIVEEIMSIGKQGVIKGRGGAKALTAVQRKVNDLKALAYTGDNKTNIPLQRLVESVTNGFEDGVAQSFEKAGLGAQYAQKSALYSEYGNAVQAARQLLTDKSGKGTEQLLNRVIGTSGRNLSAKGQVQKVVELLGEEGQQQYEKILLNDAGAKFSAWFPRFGMTKAFGPLGVPAAAAAATTKLGLSSTLTGGMVTQISPRVVANQTKALSQAGAVGAKALPYATKAMDFVKSLTPQAMKDLLQDDTAMRSFMSSTISAFQNEDEDTKKLLQGAGVGP